MVRYTDSKIYNIYTGIVLEGNDQKGVTREQLIRLQKLKSELGRRVPLFDTYIKKVPVIFTYDFDTMAVDDYDNLYINPDFFDKLSDDGVVSVLAHEMYHIFYGHASDAKRANRDNRIDNFATDYVINRELHKDGMNITNILKVQKEIFHAVTPLFINNKYYIKVGDETIDVTNLSALGIYVALIDESRRQNKSADALIKDLEKNHGKSGDPQTPDKNDVKPAPLKKDVYNVGDIVADISSGVKGKIISASQPDSNGDQILSIDWDLGGVNETFKYIKEDIQKGVSSKTVKMFKPKPPQPPSDQKQPDNQKQSGEQQPDNQKQPGKQQPGNEKQPGKQQPGKQQPGEGQSGEGQSGEGQSGGQQSGDEQSSSKQSSEDIKQDKKRTEKISYGDKQGDLKKHEITREQIKRSQKRLPGSFKISGDEHVNWADVLKDVLVKSVEYSSTIMPDWRSEGVGRYMRGRKEVKQKVVVTVMVDTSGSVSKRMYNLFMNEVINIMGTIKGDSELNLILWHDYVYSTSDEFHIQPDDVNKIKNVPFENGGTTFSSAVEFYDRNRAELDDTNILIVFTDGDFFDKKDLQPDLLQVIPDSVKIVFVLFQPNVRQHVDKYTHSNISVIDTNIRG